MRATEALELSNPINRLDQDLKDVCTHIDYNHHKTEIIEARKLNRGSVKMAVCFTHAHIEEMLF